MNIIRIGILSAVFLYAAALYSCTPARVSAAQAAVDACDAATAAKVEAVKAEYDAMSDNERMKGIVYE